MTLYELYRRLLRAYRGLKRKASAFVWYSISLLRAYRGLKHAPNFFSEFVKLCLLRAYRGLKLVRTENL